MPGGTLPLDAMRISSAVGVRPFSPKLDPTSKKTPGSRKNLGSHVDAAPIPELGGEAFAAPALPPTGPSINSISPDNVPAGQTVSISGSNLGNSAGTITVGGVSAHIVSWGAYSISFQVPGAIATGADPVVVTTSGGQTASTTLHVVFAPVINSITPTTGVPYTQVTVAGSGFGTVSGGSVTFTGVAGQIISWTDRQIVVKAPDGGAGRGPVVVTWQGVNSNGITFNYVPSLFYLSNSTVSRNYGSFSVVGENFLPTAGTVTLNGVPLSIYSWSNNSISLPVPQNNCTGPIVVTTIYGSSNPVTLTITGSTPGCINTNQPPVANAGSNQSVALGSTVQLDGSGSTDPAGLSLSYHWTLTSKPSGSNATLSSTTIAKSTFVADVAGNYVAQLIVSDQYNSSAPSTVTVSTQIAPPTANAGSNQTITTGATVQLDGSHSTDPNGFALTYQWSFVSVPSGSSATLANATSVNPTFVADKVGSYVAQLIVNNGHLSSQASQVTISDVYTAPTANAGPNQSVEVESLVQLDGSHSTDLQGYPLTYSWTILSAPNGSRATLTNPTAVNPTFRPDELGDFIIQLIVNDGVASSAPKTVTISTNDVAPVAQPGSAQTVTVGQTVTLDGTGSTDSDGQALTYSWSITTKPSGSNAALANAASAKPTFVADLPGDYVVQLIVNDGFLSSAPATVHVSSNDVPPVANPGQAQSVPAGSTVQLDGSASTDSDGQALTYSWAILSQPSGANAVLSSTTVANPTFIAHVVGTYVVQLIVNDGFLSSQPATVSITATPVNQAPVVTAGPNQTITLPTNSTTLNGSATDDGLPNGTLTIQWSVVSKPSGSTVTFGSPQSAVSSVTFSGAGVYVLQLSANDSQLTTTSTTTVTVQAPASNQPPVVNAGPAQTIQLPTNSLALQGTATDDGLPNGTLTVGWSEIAGPGVVTFSNPTSLSTTANFVVAGVYLLRLSASDSQLTSTSDVTITVQNPGGANQAPVVSAGTDQATDLPTNSVVLTGEVSDDGQPNGTLQTTWSQISGPVTALIGAPNSLNTQVSFAAAGTYIFQLSATDSQLTSTATVTVKVYATGGSNQPPYVSAGADQTVVLPNGALLNGVAVDDGKPNGTLAVQWQELSGPGTVVFSNPQATITTASFPSAGEYVLQLSATDSVLASVSTTHVHVLSTSGARTNQGTDFWLAFPTNFDVPPPSLNLYISGDVATSGTVSVPGIAFNQAFSVTVGSTTTVTVPTSALLLAQPNSFSLVGDDLVQNLGIHVTSLKPVTISPIDLAAASTDGYLALPTPMLGTDYVTLGYKNVSINSGAGNTPTQFGSDFAVVAPYDGTTLTVTPSSDTLGRKAGVPYQVILNAGRTYELVDTDKLEGDLSGTTIHSDKPVAVFGGHWCANIGNAAACNQLLEQLPATSEWGNNFIASPFSLRTSPYVIHVVAANDNTNVSVNGQVVATLSAAKIYEQLLTQPANITSDQPVLVAQYAESAQTDSSTNTLGDPTMVLLQPITAYSANYRVIAPADTVNASPSYTFQDHFANISVPQSALSSLKVNGTSANTSGFTPIANSIFTAGSVSLQPGQNTLSASAPFGAIVYGLATFDAYSYPAGFSVDSVPNATLTISPTSQTQQVGSQRCVVASVTDSTGTPLGGIRVGFGAGGANAAQASVLTDFAGLAQFCYAGNSQGTDSITASVSNLSATGTTTWTSGSGNIAPYVNAGPAQTILLPQAQPLTLSGIAIDDGLPTGTLTTQWSTISGPGTVTFTPTNSAESQVTFSAAGTYQLQLSANDGSQTSTSQVTITVNAAAQNAPPVVSAGPNVSLDLNQQTDGLVTLNGSVSDDGLPAGTKVMSSWIVVGCTGTSCSPAQPLILSPTSAVTQVYFPPLTTPSGVWTFQLTGDDTQLTASSQVTVTVSGENRPPVITQSTVTPNILTMPNNTATATATVVDDGLPAGVPLTYQWTQVSGPPGVTFSSPTSLTTQVAFPQAGTYEVQIAASDSVYTISSQIQVFVNPENQAPTVNLSLSPQTITLPTSSSTLTASATDDGRPTGSTLSYQWSLSSGSGTATFSAPTSPSTTVTVSKPGSYNLTVTVSDSQLSTSATATLFVNPQNQAPVVSAGPNQSISLTTPTTTLLGTATDDGLPSGSSLSVMWNELSGPGIVSFATPTSATTSATFPAAGTYVLRLTGSDTQLSTTSDVTITVTEPQNQPPTVFAGVPQTINFNGGINLSGIATDDGLPTGSTLGILWTQVSGPAAVHIFSPNSASTFVNNFTAAGSYVFQLTASDTQLTSSSTVTITVLPPVNQPPVVSAGFFQQVTLPSNTFTLNGSVSDDGLPNGTLNQIWTQTGGPGGCTFTNAAQPVAQATCTVSGTYNFQLSASDGQFTSISQVSAALLPANTPPSVFAGPQQSITLPMNTVTLTGTVSSTLQSSALTYQWVQSGGPAPASIATPNQLTTLVTFPSVGNFTGSYTFILSVNDGTFTQTSSTAVTVNPASAPPTAQIMTPADDTEVTSPVTVTGNVSPVNWVLEYSPFIGDSVSGNWTQFARAGQSSTQINNTTLGTFDPTSLANGIYAIRLTATDQYGQFATSTVTVDVTRNMKVGVLQLAFNDLTVPVAGVPIQVVRSYNSLENSLSEDFGFGWSVGISNIRIQKNHIPGRNWNETTNLGGFFPQYCLGPISGSTVSIIFPDGRTYAFQPNASPQCQSGGPITQTTLAFTELPGAANTAGATLVPADGGQVIFGGNVPGTGDLDDFSGNTYNPTQFILTTADGTSYTIDETLGLTNLRDRVGNTLTISLTGIVSSTGKSIAIHRDAQNRITEIDDPNGNRLLYVYNGAGNLDSFTDAAGNVTGFNYFGRQLTSIFPPGASQPIQFQYDGTGKLIGSTDQLSNQIQYTHDVADQVETIKDRNGNSTVYNYDADGNVIKVTDALGHIKMSTFDSNDNKLSDTNMLGKTTTFTYDGLGNQTSVTDPLGHRTSYTFNGNKQPLTVTDANGNVTTNTYDSNGNLTSTKDALGNTTTNTYFPSGQLQQTTDALNHTTSFIYDTTGNLTQQTDSVGNVTNYTFDGNGNRKTQAVTRTKSDGTTETLTTQYQYDGNNRVTKTTNADGTFTQIQYDSLGNRSAIIDAKNQTTGYVYDADSHLTKTNYPDSTSASTTYDANGNRLTSTDRGGHKTTYTYDKLNRPTATTFADNSGTSTTYDAIGQVLTSQDANGNSTSYVYDDAGRRTSVTDALSHTTSFGYDNSGNRLSVTDANNHTTQYVYDASNRRIKVIYPDTKFETTVYDALGRVTSRTDANGLTTRFGYDNLGRLTNVTDALNQLTSYGYDEVGNRITQTDANSHTTTYAYDRLGRRVQRTLPLGQAESYAYDANGNVSSRIDFNGRITTYTYDTLNRLLSKTADAFFVTNHLGAASINFTYNANGQRATMSDPSGTTTYTYDDRNRLTTKATPEGTLSYSYDAASNVKTIQSGNVNGASMAYGYDALNRLSSVIDAAGATAYTYDNVGNLQSVTYPNSVAHNYGYDNRNHLTSLAVAGAGGQVVGYSYLLDATGHRLSVTELSGRTVNFSYDNLYRLTSESIAADPHSVNGTVGYTYDSVGNRKQLTSTLATVPAGLWNYDANDRFTAGDTYDANGNTASSGGITNAYDFENHLVQKGGVTVVYDGDGNRVSKSAATGTTQYLVDSLNPTGYAQVMDEVQSGSVPRAYTWGLALIDQSRPQPSAAPAIVNYYVFDGHGSVRALTDMTGGVTDTYDYDAFGNLIHSTGTTPNVYLYAGQQFDPELSLYYNRARYLSASTGRFWTADNFEGDPSAPASLHRYLYGSADPVNRRDPTGHDDLASISVSLSISTSIGAISGVAFTGSLKGALLGGAAGFGLGFACLTPELCTRAAVTGAANAIFQFAANYYDNYVARELGLPHPDSQKQREAIVAAFGSGIESVIGGAITGGLFDPDDTASLAALQAGVNVALNDAAQGKTVLQTFSEAGEAALVAYLVDVAAQREFGPQFHTDQAVTNIVEQIIGGITTTLTTAISPVQEALFRAVAPDAHRYIYGN